MSLHKKIIDLVSSGFSGIWLQSYEHADAIREIVNAVKMQRCWQLMFWDPVRGLRGGSELDKERKCEEDGEVLPASNANHQHPLAALEHFKTKAMADGEKRLVMIMRNVDGFLVTPDGRIGNPALLHSLQTAIEQGEGQGRHVIILSYPDIKIPAQLEKMHAIVEHDLPNHDELYQIMTAVTEGRETVRPDRDSPECRLLLDAASGLSRIEAAGAFSLSLVQTQDKLLDPRLLWEMKEQAIKKAGLLEFIKADSGFDMLGGLNHVKEFCLRAFNSPNRSDRVQPKGILLLGLPGTGKSAFSAALGNELKLPTVRMDIGSLMGGIVGATEANTRRALKQIDAMAPCVLFVDEIEKALAGAGGGALDSGVSDRLFGSLLTWLNDHKTQVFFIASCNDISRLSKASSGAFTRAERFDAVFFMDLPSKEQKQTIWDIYLKYFEISPEQRTAKLDDEGWTGAEIKACCRLAKLLDVSLAESAEQVVPVSRTSKEQIEALKEWAHHRCLSADYKGLYDRNGEPKFMRPDEVKARPRRALSTKSRDL